ncbi:MAG: helix-turn-helix transcriptional regulator [bacterium]|nr:helix-turn-helix transcriptional regulator [bacterium]
MNFGQKVQELRKELKLSQGELAKRIGTSGTIVGRYERNEMTPSVEVARKLAGVFKVSIDYLVDESGEFTRFKDIAMVKRLEEIDKLPEGDKERIVYVVDALLRDFRTRRAYSEE